MHDRDRRSLTRLMASFVFTIAAAHYGSSFINASPKENPEKTPIPNTLTVPPPIPIKHVIPTENIEPTVSGFLPIDDKEVIETVRFSQVELIINYRYEESNRPRRFHYQMGATIIDLGDNFLLTSAGHGFSQQNMTSQVTEYLSTYENIKHPFIQVPTLTSISVDGHILNLGEFGLSSKYLRYKPYTDYSIVVIPKEKLPQSILKKLENKVIQVTDISFSPPSKNDRYILICRPEKQGYKESITMDAHYFGDEDDLILLNNSFAGKGCSGNGAHQLDDNMILHHVGTYARYEPSQPEISKIYPFSILGRKNFEIEVTNAIKSIDPTFTNFSINQYSVGPR